MHRRSFVAAAAAMPVAGCGGIKTKDRGARLGDTLKAYAGAIRWGNFETAAVFAMPRSAQTAPVNPATLAGLRVTGYSIRIDRINEAGDEAVVNLSFTYYQETRGTLNTVEQHATWYFDEPGGRWLMDDSLPRFKL